MNKLFVICGPTSTGKTYWALKLAKKYNGELISADSRQVYKGMDIGTGKDLPEKSKYIKGLLSRYGYYSVDGIKIWGYDLATPRSEFSVSEYYKFASRVIREIWKRGSLPILVGGTGLYIKSVIDGIPTVNIPKNSGLRKHLEGKDIGELYDILAQLDSIKAAALNVSDRKNPRRLVRAIEVAQWKVGNIKRIKSQEAKCRGLVEKENLLMIGFKLNKNTLDEKIKKRVGKRIKEGIEDEIKKLLKSKVSWNMQSMASIGYGIWKDYFEGKIKKQMVVDKWVSDEVNYAKRQITWFKTDRRISWFDSDNSNFPDNMEKVVERWYKNN